MTEEYSAKLKKYEDCLLRKAAVKKKAFHYDREYIHEFGELIIAVFEKKMECIRLKKTIEFCRRFINRGEGVDMNKLNAYLADEMGSLILRLGELKEAFYKSGSLGIVSEADMLKIKKIYRRIAKKIHPDINPETAGNEELMSLWNRLVDAYNCNDLKDMEECEFLIGAALERLGIDDGAQEVENIEEKISVIEAEIEHIMNTDPYLYREILEDDEKKTEKREELEKELEEYTEYGKQLDEILMSIVKDRGAIFEWKMS